MCSIYLFSTMRWVSFILPLLLVGCLLSCSNDEKEPEKENSVERANKISKDIIEAFVTLNDKLETGNELLYNSHHNKLFEFEAALAELQSANMEEVQYWRDKAEQVEQWARGLSNFLLKEADAVIQEVEGRSHVELDSYGWLRIENMNEIVHKDNYEVTTRLFCGPDHNRPNERGMGVRDSILSYRNRLCSVLGNFQMDSLTYAWEVPDLYKRNPDDTAYLAELSMSLSESTVPLEDQEGLRELYRYITETVPETYYNYGELIPWSMAQFDHSPLVATIAVFVALKTDVIRAQSLAMDFLARKLNIEPFSFEKIEPLAFQSSAYFPSGDSLSLDMMIRAYDSLQGKQK